MRNATKRKGKAVMTAIGAAAVTALAGSNAHGAISTYTITVFNMGIQTIGSNSWQDWVVAATRTDGGGTGLDAIDVTIDTGGTANLGIDVEKISGIGLNTKYDANVDGGTFDSTGVNAALNQNSPAAPLFGDAVGGTFIGIGQSELNPGPSAGTGFTTDITNNPFETQAGITGVNSSGSGVVVSGKGLVFANANIGTPNVDPYGPVGGLPLPAHGGATLSAQFTNSGSVNAGSTGNALLNGAVTKLEVIVTENDPGQALSGINGPLPFANIVVPVGTTFTVSGALAPNSPAGTAPFSTVVNAVNVLPPPPPGITVSLKQTASGTGANIGTAAMVGSNGSYTLQNFGVVGAQQTAGNLVTTGWNPINDHEIFGLKAVGATTLSQLISDLGNAMSTTGSGVVVEAPTGSAGALLTSLGDNVEIDAPNGSGSVTPSILSYDLTNYSGNGTVTIQQVTVIPEPTSLGALALGGLGLLGRRRRKIKAVQA